jgi:dihydroxyacetone kinase-like protein
MKKLINKVDNVLSESLRGFVAAHGDIVGMGDDGKFVIRKNLKKGKVGLISGGGSGHEPLHAGLVGHGMLDAACPGQVFTSPTPDQMIAAAEAADTGAGLLFIVKNYEGDVMNFDMAREMCGKGLRPFSPMTMWRSETRFIRRDAAAWPEPWWSRRLSAPPRSRAPVWPP